MLLHTMAAQMAFAGMMSLFVPVGIEAKGTRLSTEKPEQTPASAARAEPVGGPQRN